ncbi:sulfotransferase domain protein [Medicago truncatula]|uniref:Sulfotransferase n=2 Tax=Medicago truncatula TaxID=3880 RepID=G7LHM6_MEDTR|nr:sulfotransferase domain protein [Medicago truncatula]
MKYLFKTLIFNVQNSRLGSHCYYAIFKISLNTKTTAITEDALESEQALEFIGAYDGSEASANSEAHIEEHSSTSFHIHEELIFRNKDTHLKTRSAFRDEHSMLGLFLMIEPTFVDEYLKGTINLGLLYTESQDYNFVNKIRSKHPSLQIVSLKETFESFCNGVTPFGSFWEHTLGYLKESMTSPDKILFLKYEELKEDPIFHVTRLATFLGYSFTQEEESKKVVENIINLCCFETMKELEVNKSGFMRSYVGNKFFFRKAKVGDWKNYLSPSMEEKLSKIVD